MSALAEQVETTPSGLQSRRNVVLSCYMADKPTPGPMDAEGWVRVREILHWALELAPEQRPDYLDEACGADARLRAEVESLIAASGRSVFIDRPAPECGVSTVTVEKPPSLLNSGQTIAHYQVVEKIGEGGMGTVYKAIDKRLNRLVALKVISHAHGSGHEKLRFAREARAASALNHPNIVTIYEFNTEGGLDFIAMEYVKGTTLDKLMVSRLPLETLLEYARQAAGAIAKAHESGIVHRDLKPSNIMVTGEGAVKVLDFGLAKQQDSASADSDATETQPLTKAGTLVGTPSYMSPEQAMGEPADWRADIFSFGVILYEIACGRRPFQGKNSQATLHQIAHKDPPAAAAVNPSTPPELATLIEKCLKKVPEERPQSMAELFAALTRLVHSGATAPAPATRRRAIVAGALGLATIAAGLLVTRLPHSTAPAAGRILTYSIEAQKMRDGKPVGEPYAASPGDAFEGGWKFRLRARSPQPGFLYLINRGPDKSGADRLWILYPPKASGAALPPDRETLTGWYVFDQNPGTERLWIVWSERPVTTIEQPLHGGSGGRVESQDVINTIERLLAGLRKGRRTTGANGINHVELAGPAEILGELLELPHH